MENANSLGGESTFAGQAKRPNAEASLGDERTLGGEAASGLDAIIDDIEVVDLETRYKPEGTLGQGGMGAVLLATDTRLDRKVAIKRILGEAAGNRMAVQRFLTEAKSIAALNHPNIVQIYDYGRAKDGPFLIMEYVAGGSLLDRCRDGAMPLEDAVDIACQLCDGLAKAHDLGIIHRDIKPANVLLTKDGLPKLTDFGLAKAQSGDHGQTMTGAVLGTPDFMPPEQRRDAAEVDHRSDLWSLAATVYQMATGRSPKIIRFDLLPAELTKVLGKALEDRKEDRYQSARELRDAVKVSLRAAAVMPVVMAEGQCPSCGIQNDPNRRFCRGCGGSLEAPCLSCSTPMPVGEEICGNCGAKQMPLLESRRAEMAVAQATAERLLGDFEFDEATAIASRLRDEPHPRLSHLKRWGEEFLPEIEKSRSHQVEKAVESLVEAAKHEEACDFLSAIFALESVPAAMRSASLPGAREPVSAALGRVKGAQSEVRRLESLVKERVAAKSLDGLLVEVESLLALQPGRSDAAKMRAQLLDRQNRQTAARDTAIASAAALLETHDYAGALSALSAVPAPLRSVEVSRLQVRASELITKVRDLTAQIREAVAGKQLDGLLETVDDYLRLKPTDGDVLKLRQSLAAREEKLGAEVESRLKQAQTLVQACRFDEAAKILLTLPEHRDPDGFERLKRCRTIANARSDAIKALTEAAAGGYRQAISATGAYREQLASHGVVDVEFAQLLGKTEAAHLQETQHRALLRTCGIVAGSLAAVAILLTSGLWIRSNMRSASLDTAVGAARWDEVLAIDPDNTAAFVGRAMAKLAATPPDIEGAFADIEAAEKLPRGMTDAQAARGRAHALRAADHARNDRLAEATRDLTQAAGLSTDPSSLADARAALTAAWLARAEKAVAKHDLALVRSACDSATKAGAAVEQVRAAVLQHAADCVVRFDATGLETAIALVEKYGVGRSEVADLWLQYADKAIKNKDSKGVQAACDSATKAGAAASAVAAFRARGMVLEAGGMWDRGESERASVVAIQAIEINGDAAIEMLQSAQSEGLKTGVVSEYLKRFDEALAAGRWDEAREAVATAMRLDAQAETWWTSRLAAEKLPTAPPTLLASLPPTLLASLPPEVITAIPPITNSVGIKMKLLPGGTFTMGEAGSDKAAPHPVTLTKPSYIGMYEVTNAQWKQVMGSIPSEWKEDDRPVTQVTWEETVEFCRKLSAMPEERKAGRVYRLPTEAEWEYACRAGTTTKYSFGDDESRLGDYGWFIKNSDKQIHPVGQKKPNAWGMYDMHGNVSEWCSDWYGDYPKGAVTDPQGPPGALFRVVRGASGAFGPGDCRSARRGMERPTIRFNFHGVRLALSPHGAEPVPPEAATGK